MTTIGSHTQPIVVDAKAIVLVARRAVLLAEAIGCATETIDLVAPGIDSVRDAHRTHAVAPFGHLTNVIGNAGESRGIADDLTSPLGAAIAIRTWASGTERRVRWHRARRPSAPPHRASPPAMSALPPASDPSPSTTSRSPSVAR